jgi:hypothetical protein
MAIWPKRKQKEEGNSGVLQQSLCHCKLDSVVSRQHMALTELNSALGTIHDDRLLAQVYPGAN